MPKFKVTVIAKDYWTAVVEADNEDEAEDLATDLCQAGLASVSEKERIPNLKYLDSEWYFKDAETFCRETDGWWQDYSDDELETYAEWADWFVYELMEHAEWQARIKSATSVSGDMKAHEK